MPSAWRQMFDTEPGDLARPQRRGKADEQQRAVARPGQGVGDRLDRSAQPLEHERGLFGDRLAVRPFDASEGSRDDRGSGRRRIAGEQVQVADRGMAQAQRIDREPGMRLGGEKRRDRLRRCRQRIPPVFGAPRAEPRDGGAVGAAGVFGARRAAVLRRGLGGVRKARDRRRQFDDRLEVKPVRDVVGCGAGGSGAGRLVCPYRAGLGQDDRDRAIVGRHHPA